MIKQGDRFKDIATKKLCVAQAVTEDNGVVSQCVDRLSQTLVSRKDLNRFFERSEE